MKTIFALAAACLLSTGVLGATLAEKREDLREVSQKTLDRLYKAQPSAKDVIAKAAGYAVFSNFGMKILVAGGGKGAGMVVHRKSGQETFMKMVEVQAGLGFGVKRFRQVWVFESESKLNDFVNKGWELGAQSTASAKGLGMGTDLHTGAMSISPGVWIYQLVGDGLALELTAKGTRYYKDTELN